MLMFAKVFIAILLISHDISASKTSRVDDVSESALLKRINKQIMAERMQQKFGQKRPNANWDSAPSSPYTSVRPEAKHKDYEQPLKSLVSRPGESVSDTLVHPAEVKHKYYQQATTSLSSSLTQGLRMKPKRSALVSPSEDINNGTQELNNKKPIERITKLKNEAEQSSFISKTSDWNTYGRRFQVYIGVGYFYKLVHNLKCPIKNHYAVLRPLVTENNLNESGNGGIILPYKLQPALLAKNRSLNAPRFETGIIFYSGNGKSLNINLAGDSRKYRFFLKEVPHERKTLNLTLQKALENNQLVSGEIPRFYISNEELFDLLGDQRNFVEQQFEYELTIGVATTVKEKWWIEAMFGISNTYLKSFEKGYHLLGLVTSVRLDYEIIRQIRLGIAYQYRTINRAVKGFSRVNGSNHAIIATFRLLVP